MRNLMKKIFVKLRKVVISILLIIISIGMFFGVIFFFRYLGLKGLLGFAVGGLLVGYVMLSEHPFIAVYREQFLK